jgi:hypothetical protein
MSQLSWRRLFLAAVETESSGTAVEKVRAANEKCKDVLFWYAALQGNYFVVGALKGVYDYDRITPITSRTTKGNAVDSYAEFFYTESRAINIYEDGKLAACLMYALSSHLQHYFGSLPSFLDQCRDIAAIQDYRNAKSGSRRQQAKSPRSDKKSSNEQGVFSSSKKTKKVPYVGSRETRRHAKSVEG